MQSPFESMSRDDLLKALTAFAKSWLAHDGCWFLAAEERHGLQEAIRLDANAWSAFAPIEAKRILEAFSIPPGGGLEALEKALSLRMYGMLNPQRSEWSEDRRELRFVMDGCRVQEARRRKGLPDFPCRPVGEVEFAGFARAVDPRIRVRTLRCPPDAEAGEFCAWSFTLGPEPAHRDT